jgi:hypothetical protein
MKLLPGRDANTDAALDGAAAMERLPRPSENRKFHGTFPRIDRKFPAAAVAERPDVTAPEFVLANQFTDGCFNVPRCKWNCQAVGARRIHESLQVLRDAKQRRTFNGVITAEPLEHSTSIMQCVR